MKTKIFRLDTYRAEGELVVLKEPATPFERGTAVVRIRSDCEIGTDLTEGSYKFDCVVRTFLPDKKDVHIISQSAPNDSYRHDQNEITFSFRY